MSFAHDLYDYTSKHDSLTTEENKLIEAAENEAFGSDCGCESDFCEFAEPQQEERELTDFEVLHTALRDEAKYLRTAAYRIESLSETILDMYEEVEEEDDEYEEDYSLYPSPSDLAVIYKPQTLLVAFIKSLFV